MALKYGIWLAFSILSITLAMNTGQQDIFNRKNVEFANELYSVLAKHSPGKNLIFSPFSIHTCTAMLYTGATGKTAEELEKGLKLPQNNRQMVGDLFKNALKEYSEDSGLRIANKIYVSTYFQIGEAYHQNVIENFYSETENIEFATSIEAATIINDWVAKVTNDKITSIVSKDDFSGDTIAVLINAIHFIGNWSIPLNNAPTKLDFWISEKESVKAEMMFKSDDFLYGYHNQLSAQILEIKFRDSELSMVILLPDKINGLTELEEKLTNFDILSVPTYPIYIDVLLPKFKIEMTSDLEEIITEMGMGRIFTLEQGKFDDIHENIYVSKFIHKAFIDINEKGVKAAAVTSLQSRAVSGRYVSKLITFKADHPFFFAIKSKSAILFMGRFVQP